MTQKEFVVTGRETRPQVHAPVPGPAAQKIIQEDAEAIATTTKTSPIAARAAKGAVVLSVDGDLFLDFSSGVGVLNTGHCHPRIVKAIQEQAAQLIHFAGTDFYYDVQVKLAQQLAEATPGAGPKKVFYTNSGTEANEAALKLAAWTSRRNRFLSFQRAFHGRTLGSLALTNSKTVHRERFQTMPGAQHVPFPNAYRNVFGIDGYADPDGLTSAVLGFVEELFDTSLPPQECAAMFVEPIQGEGGYNLPPKAFYPKLKKLLDGHGILLVADEVQTGMGRTGKMFAMEHFGTAAHVTTVAKALGSGLPIGAAVFESRLDFGVQGAHSNTFGGNPVACAAALATLETLREENLVGHAAKVGEHLGDRLRELHEADAGIGDVRGLGLLWAVEFVTDGRRKTPDPKRRDAVLRDAYQRGLILLPCGKSSIRIIPPLVISEAQIDGGVDVLAEALRAAPAGIGR